MNQLLDICLDAARYPLNLPTRENPDYELTAFHQSLSDHEHRLFSNTEISELIFHDLDSDGKAFWKTTVQNLERLKSHLGIEPVFKRPDPRCRFLFVHAPHSREPLKTTREMLMQTFTYLQVMPEFLDLLYPLGKRDNAQDFYSGNFTQHTHLSDASQALRVPERSWSGFDFQLCYSLKSVERSEMQTEWPWSIRHSAVHHTFDVKNVRSTWVIVKGNRLMERRISAATSTRGPPAFSAYEKINMAFTAAMRTHLMMFDWSAENWRWYITFLEDQLKELTGGAISFDANVPTSPLEKQALIALGRRTSSQASQPVKESQRSRKFSFPRFSRSTTQETDKMPSVPEQQKVPAQQFYVNPKSGKKQPLPPGKSIGSPQTPTSPKVQYDGHGQRMFNFRHLQDMQDLEESVNEMILVLKLNANTTNQVCQFYRSLFENKEVPETIQKHCLGDMVQFERRLQVIDGNTNAHTLRAEALLRLIADRKTLLYGLLEYQNTQSNRQLALESRESNIKMERSTQRMETMTTEMSEIARKTQTETVSMKIITLVTLFFLPGTFISVSISFFLYLTIMSTDIIHWNNGRKYYQAGALHIYLAICLPFMAATFAVWWTFHWYEKRKECLQKQSTQEKLAADTA